MKRLLALAAICLPIYLFAQGFGNFATDQPYLAKDRGSVSNACDAITSWNPALNSDTYALYDFSCLQQSIGSSITNVIDFGTNSLNLIPLVDAGAISTAPIYTNNALEINGRGYAFFDGISNSLSSGTLGSPTIKPTTVIVVSQTYLGASASSLFDNAKNNHDTGGIGEQFFYNSSGIESYALSGTFGADVYLGPIKQPTDWTIFEVLYNGADSFIKVNDATAITGTTSANSYRHGVTLGSKRPQPLVQNAKAKIAWAAFFTNTLSLSVRSNIYYYLFNRYNINPTFVDIGSWNPATNSSLLAAYDVRSISANNGDTITSIPDLGPKSYNLRTTNSPKYLVNASTNGGIPHIGFNLYGGSSQMAGTNFSTTYPQPTTVFLVMQSNSGVEGTYDWFTDNCDVPGTAGVAQAFFKTGPTTTLNVFGINDLNQSQLSIYEIYLNGGSSYVKTNNVTMMSGGAGTDGRHGISIAGSRDWNLSTVSPMNFYWAAYYTNTLNSTEKSNIYYYLKNSFKIITY